MAVLDHRLVLFLPDGAVTGRVAHYTETGLTAVMESEVPRDLRIPFTIHLQGRVIGGELTSLGLRDEHVLLQFVSLGESERRRLDRYVVREE